MDASKPKKEAPQAKIASVWFTDHYRNILFASWPDKDIKEFGCQGFFSVVFIHKWYWLKGYAL
jgi:hypothetical protein